MVFTNYEARSADSVDLQVFVKPQILTSLRN